MAHARFSSVLPGRWSPQIIRRVPPTVALPRAGNSEDKVANGAFDMKARSQVEANNCLHVVLDVLLDVLWRAEDDFTDEKVNYNVRTPHVLLRVACPSSELVSDLLARVAQIATDAERDRFHAAALRIQSSGGVHVCASTRLADLDPSHELVLGWTLSEVAVAKCSNTLSSKGRSLTNSTTHSVSSSSSFGDESDFPDLCDVCSLTVSPSACFVDEPNFGPCLLLNNRFGELTGRGSSERLVCTLTF